MIARPALLAVPVLWVLFLALFALFLPTLGHPVRPAEAAAATAVVDACHTGDAIASHQSGEHEPRRLPLQTWVLGGLAGWQASAIDVRLARWVSFVSILLAGAIGAAGFGSRRPTTVALVLATPAIWETAIRGAPGALLALLLTLAWACHDAGRRIGAPTLQWALPPILGAAASLVWSPAIVFVFLALLVESIRLAPRRQVSWFRLSIGIIVSVALIGLWQMANSGFTIEPGSWWSRMSGDLLSGDPLLATRGWRTRLILVAGVMMSAVGLAILGGWPMRRLPAVSAEGDGPGKGITLAAVAISVWAVVSPGVPSAATIPAAIVALSFLGTRRLLPGPVAKSRNLEIAATALLVLLLAMSVLHQPRGPLDASGLEAVSSFDEDTPVVVDREIGPRETWEIVSRLGRPAGRAAEPGVPAWFVGHAATGPGFAIQGPAPPQGWSLLGRPLTGLAPDEETTAAFEDKLARALSEYESDPANPLAAIWVGRRIAYLGRYREAIEWYGQALTAHPYDARLWRHRGHRFISVRQLDLAIRDLVRAADLEEGKPDRVEPDGLPNVAGIPRSTTQTNIWYHLGLAYYLKGDLEQTVHCYRRCLELSTNDDMWVAAAHWLHVGLRRLGRDAEAAELLQALDDEMEILENESYHDLLMLYAGKIEAEELQQRLDRGEGASQAALAYGLARWYDDRGDDERAVEAYRRIVAEAPWAAFGAIAAEAELAARATEEIPVW